MSSVVSQAERQAAEYFGRLALEASHCAVCRRPKVTRMRTSLGATVTQLVPFHVHHCLSQQHIREACRKLGLPERIWLWDRRNALVVCDLCHTRHHRALPRISRRLLRAETWAFARELGQDHKLEREYPDDQAQELAA